MGAYIFEEFMSDYNEFSTGELPEKYRVKKISSKPDYPRTVTKMISLLDIARETLSGTPNQETLSNAARELQKVIDCTSTNLEYQVLKLGEDSPDKVVDRRRLARLVKNEHE